MPYTPVIIVRIPSDVATANHAAIGAEIKIANANLGNERYATKADAVNRAAQALSRSNVGACGYASAINPVGRPPRLFTCNTCRKVLGAAAVRTHKCLLLG